MDQPPSPGAPYGRPVQNLPEGVAEVYDGARRCMAVGAYTSATLACRKLLMHVAVDKVLEAKPGETFLEYVKQLEAGGYISPAGKSWLDYIRRSSNEANHEIVVKTRDEAEGILEFAAFLLTAVYDFPARVPDEPSTIDESGDSAT